MQPHTCPHADALQAKSASTLSGLEKDVSQSATLVLAALQTLGVHRTSPTEGADGNGFFGTELLSGHDAGVSMSTVTASPIPALTLLFSPLRFSTSPLHPILVSHLPRSTVGNHVIAILDYLQVYDESEKSNRRAINQMAKTMALNLRWVMVLAVACWPLLAIARNSRFCLSLTSPCWWG